MDKINEKDLKRLLKLADRQEIWDAIVSYTRGMDRLDPELVVSAFHPDGISDFGMSCGAAIELAEVGIATHTADNSKTHHFMTNHHCELDGDTARTETYFLYCGAQEKGPTDVFGGRYLDELERRDDEWKIAKRLLFIEWVSAFPEAYDTGTMASRSARDWIVDPRSRRSREDASYIRPLPVSIEKGRS